MRLKHVASLLLAFLENLFYSGILYGWPFLEDVFTSEGYFSEYCSDANATATGDNATRPNATVTRSWSAPAANTCIAQTEHMNLIFTVSAMVSILLCFASGYLYDRVGTWFCKTLSTTLYVGAFVLFAASSSTRSYLVYPAMLCLAIGSSVIYMVNFQFANLFPSSRSTIVSALNGLFVSSSFVFWLVQAAYVGGAELSTLFYALCLPIIVLYFTFLFLSPRGQIPYPLPPDFEYGLQLCGGEGRAVDYNQNTAKATPPPVDVTRKLSVFSKLGAYLYACNFCQFAIMNLRNFFYIGSFDAWASTVEQKEAEHMTFVFGVISAIGGLAAPFVGLVDDLLTKYYRRKSGTSTEQARIQSSKVFALFSSLVSIAFSGFVLASHPSLQYAAFVLLPVSRVACYSFSYISVSTLYSSGDVGKLSGMIYALGGVASLLQNPILRFVLRDCGGDFTYANILFLALSTATLLYPVSLHLARRKIRAVRSERKDSDAVKESEFQRRESGQRLILTAQDEDEPFA